MIGIITKAAAVAYVTGLRRNRILELGLGLELELGLGLEVIT